MIGFIKRFLKSKFPRLFCRHEWGPMKEFAVNEWDSPHEWGYDIRRVCVCKKCGKVYDRISYRPKNRNCVFITDKDGNPTRYAVEHNLIEQNPIKETEQC